MQEDSLMCTRNLGTWRNKAFLGNVRLYYFFFSSFLHRTGEFESTEQMGACLCFPALNKFIGKTWQENDEVGSFLKRSPAEV